jgi:UMP-CMP kinase
LVAACFERSSVQGVLIDGFPRKLDQADAFEEEVSDVEFVLFLDCPEDELTRRLILRGQTSGRSDDNEESIRKRFATFKETCMPVIERYERMNKVHRIDGSRAVSDVFADVCPLFERALAQSPAAPTTGRLN